MFLKFRIVIALQLMLCSSQVLKADVLSFLVDPATIDNNPIDGLINGTEFSPTGSGGTRFTMTPTDNLTGTPRFLLSDVNGLSFGGGSGSTLSFDFTPSSDIELVSYTIGGGLSVNNPIFAIREGASVLSVGNSGSTSSNFAGGPVALSGGTTYGFFVTNPSAGVQRQMAAWNYNVVPEPSALSTLGLTAIAIAGSRRSRKQASSRTKKEDVER